MTEEFENNKKSYLNLLKGIWDFDDESMEYVEKRLSDEWKPVEDFNSLLEGKEFKDQRIVSEIDFSDKELCNTFAASDEAYERFSLDFEEALKYLKSEKNCEITYQDFINNKVLYNKNLTKIKKVLETIYKENTKLFSWDSGSSTSEISPEKISEWIVKRFEIIGAKKKSSKKLYFVISFNPMDWFLSSTSEEKWESCFNLNHSNGHGYQYCLGLPFLCGDKNRFLVYLTDGTEKEFMGIKTHHYFSRTWVELDENGTFHPFKWYPNDTISIETLRTLTGNTSFKTRESFKRSKYPIDVLATVKGAFIGTYSDMGELKPINGELYLVGNLKTGQQNFTKNLLTTSSISFKDLRIDNHAVNNFVIPKWQKLGVHLDMFFTAGRCSCGKDRIGKVVGDRFICQDCYDGNYFNCEECGSEYLLEDRTFVETEGGKTIAICPSCLEKARYCKVCGKYISGRAFDIDDDDENGVICSSCLSSGREGYRRCNCGRVSKNVVKYFNQFTKIISTECPKCKNDNTDFYEVFGRSKIIIKSHKGGKGIEIE